jgi:hypothetical protein
MAEPCDYWALKYGHWRALQSGNGQLLRWWNEMIIIERYNMAIDELYSL